MFMGVGGPARWLPGKPQGRGSRMKENKTEFQAVVEEGPIFCFRAPWGGEVPVYWSLGTGLVGSRRVARHPRASPLFSGHSKSTACGRKSMTQTRHSRCHAGVWGALLLIARCPSWVNANERPVRRASDATEAHGRLGPSIGIPDTGLVVTQTELSSGVHGRDLTSVSGSAFTALSCLYAATEGKGWSANSNWMSADPCTAEWFGVTCTSPGQISDIFMDSNAMDGSLPSELGDVTTLTFFSVNFNTLTGYLPSEIGRWTGMNHYFDVSFNALTGSMPTQLGRWTDMSSWGYFYVEENQLTGSLPSEIGLWSDFSETFWAYNNQVGDPR